MLILHFSETVQLFTKVYIVVLQTQTKITPKMRKIIKTLTAVCYLVYVSENAHFQKSSPVESSYMKVGYYLGWMV